MAKRKTKAKAAGAAIDEKFAEELFRQPQQLTVEQMGTIEGNWDDLNFRRARRAALLSLTRSMQQLTEGIEDDREGAIASAQAQIVFLATAKQLKNLAGLMETAGLRFMVALCSRPDMQEVVAEAQRRQNDDDAKPDDAEAPLERAES